ncbi:MAG: hypothetical protein ABSG11_18180 [Candidatus Korobacteraceae bacterium]|jgi:hypothetical protein
MSTNSSVRQAAVPSEPLSVSHSVPVQVAALLLLFTMAAWYESAHLSALADPDVWWHLSTGNWILQNHAVPHYGLFSQYSNLPWTDSSWLFDVLLATAYKSIGLRALPVLLMASRVAIAVVTFVLARGSRLNFWLAVFLAAAAQYAIPSLPAGPVVCSIILFAIELNLLFSARRTGNVHPLFWLPLLFLLWVNLDVGFMFGLLLLLLFSAVAFGEEIGRRSAAGLSTGQRPAVPPAAAAMVLAGSLVAAFVSPYFFNSFAAASEDLWRLVPYVQNLHAISFRRPQDYVLLLLAMAACFSLGRRRPRDMFQIILMIGLLALAFTRQRDIWVLALVSIAVIADGLPISTISVERNDHLRWKQTKLTTAGLVLIVFVAVVISRIPSSRETLLAKVGETFPVRASDYICANHLQPPLFNAYDWGGFLTWYLPEYPVSIDSRTELYGDEMNERYFNVTTAQIPLDADPSFANARTILLSKDSPMAVALSAVPQFRVAYQDDVSMVLLQGL